MKKFYSLLIMAILLSSCGKPDNDIQKISTNKGDNPASHDIADIIDNKSSLQQFIINAYSSIIVIDDINNDCPSLMGNSILTDQRVPDYQLFLNGYAPNLLPEERYPLSKPWFIAVYDGEIPSHARFEGHMHDSKYNSCPNYDRIFVIDEIKEVYENEPQFNPITEAQRSIKLPQDFDNWSILEDQNINFFIKYPPQATVEKLEGNSIYERKIHLNNENKTTVNIKIIDGEAPYDPRNPMVGREIFQGDPREFSQSTLSIEPLPEMALHGYGVITQTSVYGQRTSVFFIGQGRTYEISMNYNIGFEANWDTWVIYNTIIYSFKGPGGKDGDPTPTSPINKTVIESDFLSDDRLMDLAKRDFGSNIRLVKSEIVSEETLRAIPTDRCLGIKGHPNGVWIATVSGALAEDPEVLVIIAYDAITGAYYCNYTPEADHTTSTPVIIVNPTAIPVPTITPYPGPTPTP